MNYDMQPIIDIMDKAITKLNKVMKKQICCELDKELNDAFKK